MGFQAGANLTTGSYNQIMGAEAMENSTTVSNCVAIGHDALRQAAVS